MCTTTEIQKASRIRERSMSSCIWIRTCGVRSTSGTSGHVPQRKLALILLAWKEAGVACLAVLRLMASVWIKYALSSTT